MDSYGNRILRRMVIYTFIAILVSCVAQAATVSVGAGVVFERVSEQELQRRIECPKKWVWRCSRDITIPCYKECYYGPEKLFRGGFVDETK